MYKIVEYLELLEEHRRGLLHFPRIVTMMKFDEHVL